VKDRPGFSHRRLAPAGALCLAAVAGAGAPDPARSTIAARFEQMSVPVEAPFRAFSGTVNYDDRTPANSKAHLEIDTASLDLGEDYSAEVRKPEWFDSARFPRAVFESDTLKPLGGDRFEAGGRLTLKGRTQPLKFPLTVRTEAQERTFDGVVTISRAAFGIGGPDWTDTVADAVTVKFHIVVPAR
jgi:polyisoprenoid-binding protein YceI